MSSPALTSASEISLAFNTPTNDILFNPELINTRIYEWNAQHNPNYPIFVFHDGKKPKYITYATAYKAIVRAAQYVHSFAYASSKKTRRPVVAIIANTDSITYASTILGCIKGGVPVFIVSPRNAPVAVADMLSRTAVTDVLVSSDSPMQTLAAEAISRLAEMGVDVKQHPMPVFENLYPKVVDPSSPFEQSCEMPTSYDMTSPVFIMHSSGSTGHPKPISWYHKRLNRWALDVATSGANMQGTVMGAHGTPMFHGLGAFMYMVAPITGFIIAVFKPMSPPIVPTPEAVWDGFLATNIDYSFSVPSFIEQWSRDPEKVLVMKRLRGMVFGGAALNDDVGNTLAAQGVSLHSTYGASEMGLTSTFIRPNPGLDWAYFSIAPGVKCVFRPQEDDAYELVVVSPPELPLLKLNTKEGEFDAYASSDLVIPHKTVPGLWKIVGRLDEQIILSNGEKTNPVPLEKIINEDPRVHCSVMFGRGHFQNGVLIEPTKEFAIDPNDERQLVDFRNKVWPTIERVNEYAPQHSRIFKEMILVTTPSKPFEYNMKGLPRRGYILGAYNEEIEACYKAVESSAQTDVPPPTTWDSSSTLVFVRAVVESTLQHSISDDEDIFRSGGDSLQATWIRNTILGAVRQAAPSSGKRIPMNLVFAFPTVSSLAKAVFDAIRGTEDDTRRPEDLWKHVERFSSNLPTRPTQLVNRPAGSKDVVVITGTTGGFGCDALEHLLKDENVERVYAFNRANSNAMSRQRAQFRTRGLVESLLDSSKYVMVEAVLHEPGFGIDKSLLEEIRHSVTHILHNAWKVNFNMSIASFEVDMQGTRNFVDLALSSPFKVPPTILFVSSIGTINNYHGPIPVPEVSLDDPVAPFGSGYSESKWVTEHFLANVAQKTDLHAITMRLGQVTGDKLGYWNEKEWFPSLVKTALYQHRLPDMEGLVSWFPAYEAAKAFTQMRHSADPFLHLIHPRPVSWHSIIEPIASALNVPLVPYDVWLAALKSSVASGAADEVETMAANPALRILPFFEAQGAAMAPDRESMAFVPLLTEKSCRVSDALATMPQLDAERATSWVAAWKAAEFL